MRITLDIPNDLAQEFINNSLEEEGLSIQDQVRQIITNGRAWDKLKKSYIEKDFVICAIERKALPRAKQYNNIEEVEL